MKIFIKFSVQTIIILLLLIISDSFSSTCNGTGSEFSPDTINYLFSPDSFVASELHHKKIVMLADFNHQTSYSLATPVKVLNSWLNSAVDQKLIDCSLTLVLEASDKDAVMLSDFISDGNYDKLLENTGMAESIEEIEYYTNLRDISIKIDSVNMALNSNISFKIRGFEWVGISSDSTFGRMSIEQRDKWFINDRDTNISVGLIKYINANPKEEILVFYGGAHLQKGYVRKDIYTYTLKDGSKGYFLAHYLKNYFGENNVLSINQTTTNRFTGNKFVGSNLNRDYYLKSGDITPKDSLLSKFDGVIFRPIFKYCFPHHLGKLLCRKLIEEEIKNLSSILGINNQRVVQLLNNQFTDLYFGIHFTQFEEYEKWSNQNFGRLNIDSINMVRLINYIEEIFLNKYKNSNSSSVYLQGFGMLADQVTIGDTLNWRNEIWPNAFRHIKFYNSVACYWFGYPDEKATAKDYLLEFSGQDFDSPQQYLQWYRNKYYGYDF